MNDVVQPVSIDPLVWQDNMRFSKLVVDIVQGQDTLYHVMYIGTGTQILITIVNIMLYQHLHVTSLFYCWSYVKPGYGTILKALATTNKSLQGCYLEEMQLHPPGVKEPILSLQILHGDRTLFIGLNDRVVKIPLARCSSYTSEQ